MYCGCGGSAANLRRRTRKKSNRKRPPESPNGKPGKIPPLSSLVVVICGKLNPVNTLPPGCLCREKSRVFFPSNNEFFFRKINAFLFSVHPGGGSLRIFFSQNTTASESHKFFLEVLKFFRGAFLQLAARERHEIKTQRKEKATFCRKDRKGTESRRKKGQEKAANLRHGVIHTARASQRPHTAHNTFRGKIYKTAQKRPYRACTDAIQPRRRAATFPVTKYPRKSYTARTGRIRRAELRQLSTGKNTGDRKKPRRQPQTAPDGLISCMARKDRPELRPVVVSLSTWIDGRDNTSCDSCDNQSCKLLQARLLQSRQIMLQSATTGIDTGALPRVVIRGKPR